MIIDMHIHIDTKETEQNKLAERFDEAGVQAGALLSACPEESEVNLLSLPYRERLSGVLSWAKGKEKTFFPVLFVHPFEKDICEKIHDAAQSGIVAFKVICDSFHVYSSECMKMLEAIEKESKPVIFHSGILWSGKDTSQYNRPTDWEALLHFRKIKFSLGHCSWPWYDECIAVYGKYLNSYNHYFPSSEMFFDLTPGTPKIYRRDLLTKLFTVGYDVENNIMFGSDSMASDYNVERVRDWIETDNSIYDDLELNEEVREKIYSGNFLRFLSGGEVEHYLPKVDR